MRHNDQRRRRRRSAGAAFILVLLVLPALLAVSAMVINVAYMELTRTEAQIAVDAATRAAGYEYARTRSTDQAYIAARDMAARNRVAGGSLPLASSDLTYGVAYRPTGDSRYLFQQGGTNPNSVRIETRSLQQNAAKVLKPLFPVPVPFGFKPLREAINMRTELDIALVIDRSGSMAYAAHEVATGGALPAAAPRGGRSANRTTAIPLAGYGRGGPGILRCVG